MKTHGFKLIAERNIDELKTLARLYRHEKTGAELMSLINDDANKVFGITFRTPPEDSTGVAHILEHSVLCGSRKYPVKEPFVEILKGSLQTFLNAFTYPDRTCYPVASQNVRDFYNLVDIYLDAVFYPRITPDVFQQEGWHIALDKPGDPLRYQGVVYNEMRGVYSSPDALLNETVQHSLFPDTTYGLDSGGDPDQIPSLTYDRFRDFHKRYYHPSNARVYFWGDDDPDERLRIVNEYLDEFEPLSVDSEVPLQSAFREPRRITESFAAGGDDEEKGMICLNWLLTETTDLESKMVFNILSSVLLGMPGAPLRKALIESGLGEDIVGGLEDELRQMFFSVGMKGVALDSLERVEALIMETLADLSRNGIDADAVEASVNTLEFALRENNTGSYPRGLVLMLRVLPFWLYGADPMIPLAYEAPLAALKKRIADEPRLFQDLIDQWLLKNPHRTTVILRPDRELAKRRERRERELMDEKKSAMNERLLRETVENTKKLRKLQGKPDSPAALKTIPSLSLEDLEKYNAVIPISVLEHRGVPLLYHDIFTSGIVYVDAGFDLHGIPRTYLPYLPLFGRALLEMGTEREDYVTLLRHIGRKTGGIQTSFLLSAARGRGRSTAKLFLRGKSMIDRTGELLSIMTDMLNTVRLDNRERFRQMVLEEKSRLEQRLVPAGHQIVDLRIRSRYNRADRVAEETGGVSYLFFIRKLLHRVERDWDKVLAVLRDLSRMVVRRRGLLLNVTVDEAGWNRIEPEIRRFAEGLPDRDNPRGRWRFPAVSGDEGLVVPSQVNYVGKGADLYSLGYQYHGSAGVITRYLRNSWLWDRVRVQGGAYGAFCSFDRLSGILTFVSYRDPHVRETLAIFDETARFLRKKKMTRQEVTRAIIGAVGDMDAYQFPDARGYSSMARYIAGISEEERQRIRDEVLATTADDFRAFADVLDGFAREGGVTILGSEEVLSDARDKGVPGLDLVKLL